MMLLYLSFLSLLVTAQALTWKGVDWSSLLVEEAAGKTYKNTARSTQPLETILKNSGVNTVRQRVWVNPPGGDYNLAYNVKLAKRAKAAGLGIYLDLHFSDTWADPGHQTTPSGWPTDIDNLAWEVYNYTLSICNTFQADSLPISLISIGNEITQGLLWPLGSTTTSYNNIARLLHSASSGIKDSSLKTRPQIMIHLDNGWSSATQKNWYTTVLAQGPLTLSDFDVMGVSYYPFYNPSATLANLKASLSTLAASWGKSLVVAETDWPVSCPSPKYAFPPDAKSVPFSAVGQATWMKDVAGVVAGVKGGAGVFYWEPAWIENANLGSSCADCLMVDQSGAVRTSLSVFGSL